ncbi:DUF5710 domain-containing protein, partial [Chromobacterium violaceum]
MEKFYLEVPYAEKDEAKALGARWDQSQKKWYAPKNLDLTPFEKWLPSSLAISPILLAKSVDTCWKCKSTTPVYAVACKTIIDYVGDEEGVYAQEINANPVMLSNLS